MKKILLSFLLIVLFTTGCSSIYSKVDENTTLICRLKAIGCFEMIKSSVKPRENFVGCIYGEEKRTKQIITFCNGYTIKE